MAARLQKISRIPNKTKEQSEDLSIRHQINPITIHSVIREIQTPLCVYIYIYTYIHIYTRTHLLSSTHVSWKRHSSSSSPTINLTNLPSLNHGPRCHIHISFHAFLFISIKLMLLLSLLTMFTLLLK
mgnify:CR=1 FL=1